MAVMARMALAALTPLGFEVTKALSAQGLAGGHRLCGA